jgi:hypothetical protein
MITNTKVIIAALIAIFILSTSSLNAGGDRDFNRYCVMYVHDNYQGPAYLVYKNAEVYVVGTAYNDEISSLSVPQGCKLQVFVDWKFQGASNTYPPGAYPAVGSMWNDQISSAKCICQ